MQDFRVGTIVKYKHPLTKCIEYYKIIGKKKSRDMITLIRVEKISDGTIDCFIPSAPAQAIA